MKDLYRNVSFKTSKQITKVYSTSFYSAVNMLAPELRSAIHGIYGFVRLADEIVDTFLDKNQKSLLDNFERDLNEAYEHGISLNPVLNSFITTVKEYNISKDHIQSFLKSMRADLYKSVYNSTEETGEYIYGSAEVVGLMCLKVFVNGDQDKYNELESAAKSLGSAFQKVNFLRDLKADVEHLNRTYFSDLNINSFNEELKLKLINEIQNEFNVAKTGIKRLPNTSKIAVWLAYLYYKRLLAKLKVTPAKHIMTTRIRVNNLTKFGLYIQAYTSYKLKLV